MIKEYKKLKTKTRILIAVITIALASIILYYQINILNNEIDLESKKYEEIVQQTFNNKIEKIQKYTSLNIDMALEDENVLKDLKNKNREELQQSIAKYYEHLLMGNSYIEIFTIRLPDNSAFLRMHKPEMFGDALNESRTIITDTQKQKIRHFGFEIGKLKMTYRVVTPIFYKNEYLGLVEIGINPNYFFDDLKNLFNIDTALLVQKNDYDVFFDNKNFIEVDNFLLVDKNPIFETFIKKHTLKSQHINIDNKNYFINTTYNLYNHKNEIKAKILIAYDETNKINSYENLVLKTFFFTLIVLILFFIIIEVLFKKFTKSLELIINENLAKEKLIEQQSKMAAMGEMINNIAHQWKQPLNFISVNVTGLKLKSSFGELTNTDVEQASTQVMENIKFMSETIDDFRDFFKIDKNKSEFNLSNVIEKILKLLDSSLNSNNIQIVKNLDNSIIYGYENELTHSLLNIINNAKDALLKSNNDKKLILIDIKNINSKTIITIKDNANGIESQYLDKIFDRYFTTKDKENGTGIGLYMTKYIIESKFNGSIIAENIHFDYENNSFYGAKFVITIQNKNQKI